MELLKRVSEDAMVAAFLKEELHSTRFSDELRKAMRRHGVSETQITKPDITNEQDNAQLTKVLGEYRGYQQHREMFTDIPDKLAWYVAEISRNEIGNLQYVDYSYWNELTDQSYLVSYGVANI